MREEKRRQYVAMPGNEEVTGRRTADTRKRDKGSKHKT